MKHLTRICMGILLLATAFSAHATQADTLRYATFNIRYANGDRGTIHSWENRRDSMARFVRQTAMDVCGMQEVLHEQLLDLQALMPDYAFVGVGRDDGKTKGEYAPIVYRRDRWKELKSGTFWLSSTPDSVGSVGWDAALPRIATWALLQDRASGKRLMCVNTHFDHRGHEARIQSGLLILRKVREIAGTLPLVLTGDFNVDMNDEVYASITHCQEYPLVDTFTSSCRLSDCTYTFHNFGKIPQERCGKIDFIFTSPDVTALTTFIPQENRDEPATMMSDHNPIITTLTY